MQHFKAAKAPSADSAFYFTDGEPEEMLQDREKQEFRQDRKITDPQEKGK